MDLDKVLGMLFALAVLCIIFRFPNFGGRGRDRRGYRERDEQLETALARNRELERQLAQLENRIRVLERIVTDDPQELRRQFRDLGSS